MTTTNKKRQEPTGVYTFRLPRDLMTRVRALADADDRTLAWQVKKMLEDSLGGSNNAKATVR